MLKRIDEPDMLTTGRPAIFPLEVSDLAYHVDGRSLIDGITLSLDRARRTVVMGPNGAGKSLLLRLLHGLITPTAGTISWAGRPLDGVIQSRQALVFQRPTMLRRSAEDNIRFVLTHLPRAARDEATDRLLHEAKLGHARHTPARLLSGGEQQRLAIARARARAPDVLFLDEPSASLDPASTYAIEEQIFSIHAGGTKIILVTHDVGQARRIADEVVFLADGRLAEMTPADIFFERPASAAAHAYLDGRLHFRRHA
ncbi:MAG: ATP-binding cassette domain-containing protein [Hyphomicrobiaceae bacterium]